MYLVFDTETTGLPLWNQPHNNQYQPRICQLAAMLLDEQFKCVGEFCFLIKPDGWTIDPRAFDAHGITMEVCEQYGLPIRMVMSVFSMLLLKAKYVVAHNIKFDSKLIAIEYSRIPEFEFNEANIEARSICTMLGSTEICKIPHPSKRNTFKWPKLEEVYKFAFDVEHDNAHDAMADCKATACVLAWLIQQKAINIAEFNSSTEEAEV